jgi:hypothetical protein
VKLLRASFGCVLLFGPGACGRTSPPAAPPPPARVDTVIVTREIPAPLPEGAPAQICLSTGYSLPVRIAADGDTLIGEARVSIKQTRPGFVFESKAATPRASPGSLRVSRSRSRNDRTARTASRSASIAKI